MVSDVYWRYGFGWMNIGVLVVFLVFTYAAEGIAKGVFLSISLLVVAFTIYRYKRWNDPGWKSVHGRAMLLYATIAGALSGDAERSGEEFDIKSACTILGNQMCGPGKEYSIDAMIEYLAEKEGEYYLEVVEKSNIDEMKKIFSNNDKLVEHLSSRKMSPDMVICHIVEQTFGSDEAANYVAALLSGDAK